MKKILTFLLVVFIIVAGLAVGKNILIKGLLENGVGVVTGLPLSIQKLDVNFSKTFVDVEGLQLKNPKSFQDRIMVDLPKVYFNYEFGSFLKGKPHIEEIRLHLKEFAVVKNTDGTLNLDALKALQPAEKEKPAGGEAKPKPQGKAPQLQIDVLDLQIDKVTFKDYSKGGQPVIKEFPINLHEQHQNITDPNALVQLIVLKAMTNTTIAQLANFDVAGLKGTLSDTLASSSKLVGVAGSKASDTLKTATSNPDELVGDVEGVAKKGATAVKGLFGDLKKSVE